MRYPFYRRVSRLLVFLLGTALFFPGCDKGEKTEEPREETFRFLIHADGTSSPESLGTVHAYLFADGSLCRSETLTAVNNTLEIRAESGWEACLLAGAALPAETGMPLETFLGLSLGADLQHTGSAPEILAARTPLNSRTASGTVSFIRRTARIDLNTGADAGISVSQILLNHVPASTCPFTEHAAAAGPTLTYEQTYSPALSGRHTGLFRVYETASPVEAVILGSYRGSPVRIELVLPSVSANKIYTLTLRNAGATLEGVFDIAPWEEGETVTGQPETGSRILLDPAGTRLSEGVTADFSDNRLEIPASGADLLLTFIADAPVDISAVDGAVSDVTVEEARISAAPSGIVTEIPVRIRPQGSGRLGYTVILHLKNRLLANSYDYAELHIAPSPSQIETVEMAGLTWMAFNAAGRELNDQIYPPDGCPAEQVYRSGWSTCTGSFFQFGRAYAYTPWQAYNPSNNLGNQVQDVPWKSDTHLPCPEGYRVPSPAELEALLPRNTVVPGTYTAGNGESIRAELLTADEPLSTPTGVTGTPRYLRLTSGDRTLIIPLAGWKGDKSTGSNPGFGQRAVLWTDDNTGQPGGWALTHSIVYNPDGSAVFSATSLQMEAFASVRCVKK